MIQKWKVEFENVVGGTTCSFTTSDIRKVRSQVRDIMSGDKSDPVVVTLEDACGQMMISPDVVKQSIFSTH